MSEPTQDKPKSRRGFASMKKEDRQRIASLGGLKRAALGVGHMWTPEEARAARAGQMAGSVTSKESV
jgi:hypothetical protein